MRGVSDNWRSFFHGNRIPAKRVLKETQYRPLSYYAQKINVTVRTLRTDLRNLEQYEV